MKYVWFVACGAVDGVWWGGLLKRKGLASNQCANPGHKVPLPSPSFNFPGLCPRLPPPPAASSSYWLNENLALFFFLI